MKETNVPSLCVLFVWTVLLALKQNLKQNTADWRLCLRGYTALEFGGTLFLFTAVC